MSKISPEENKLDSTFGHWVKLQHSDFQGNAKCCTCGRYYSWDKLQAGHYRNRFDKATKYDERNVHPQCIQCNYFKSGAQVNHAEFINRKYGAGVSQELDRKAKMGVCQRKRYDFIFMENEYADKIRELLPSKSPEIQLKMKQYRRKKK